MYSKYADRGLEIIAFPCNNFLYQEPGTDAEILDFAVSKGATFPVMAKIDCGTSLTADPLYPFLCSTLPDSGLIPSLMGNGVKWNFAKFLCDHNGIPVQRYAPNENPLKFEDDLVALLNQREGTDFKHPSLTSNVNNEL